ncbi:Ger(x)C family spore germination protein [Psychrobacillus sp.]|uniref:Ger(x)C family spore germination protein n=1 Tax=Psychrobacillus sp. TaxID=1871623 RepID=UPI0028BF304C|nr:Ger(x)C family spore germination protein [Psychrobacillus sp.]
MTGKYVVSVIVLVAISLAGCSQKEQKVPLEDVGLVGSLSLDYIDEDQMKLTVAIPQYSKEAKKQTQIYSVVTELMSEGMVEIEKNSHKKVILNQLRVVLVDEESARSGQATKVIRSLYRNAEVANKVLVAVVKGNAEEILRAEYPDKPAINFYLSDLLQAKMNTAFNPNTNFHDFMYTQTNPVIDTIMPSIEGKDGLIELNGVALFDEEKMIKILSPQDALIIQALQGRKKIAPLYLSMNHESYGKEILLLDLIHSKVKIKSNKNFESPKVSITLKVSGTLAEYKGARERDLDKKEAIVKLEKDIDAEIKRDIGKFLEKLKELKVDPIGLSENFRMYYNGKWTTEQTKEIISKLEWDVSVEVTIISTGTLK